MIVGTGIDICPVDRIAGIIHRQGHHFTERVFTPAERAYADKAKGNVRNERFAARFAAKEATIKALGGARGVGWKDIEIHHGDDGAPRLLFHGNARVQVQQRQVTRCHISLSHAGGQAVAMVILEATQS